MKTKVFLSVLFATVLTLTSVKSVAGTIAGKEVSVVREQIQKALSTVNFHEGEEVVIYFKVVNNKVEITDVKGESSALVSEVKSKLEISKLEAPESAKGVFFVKVNFVDAMNSQLVAQK